jgi:hypothetical protein
MVQRIIDSKLIASIVKYLTSIEETTGKKPDSLFLGYEEYTQIQMHFLALKGTAPYPLSFWGCQVYYVTAPSFMAAGWRHK